MRSKICCTVLIVFLVCVVSIFIRNTFWVSNEDTGIRNVKWNISMEELAEKEEQQKDVTYAKVDGNQFIEYTQYWDLAVYIHYQFVDASLETIEVYFDIDVEKDWISIMQKIYAAEGEEFANSKESKEGQSYMRTWEKNNNRYKLTCNFKKNEMYITVCKK